MWILLLPVALLVGVWLHELVHALAVIVVRGKILNVDLLRLHVDYRVSSLGRERVVRHAPFVVGVLSVPLIASWLTADTGGILLATVWTGMTVTGGRGEFGLVPK